MDWRALPPDPAQLFGDLFEQVQMRRLFGDGKTFVDLEPNAKPEAIMDAWRRDQPQSDEAIRAFVAAHFSARPDYPVPAARPGLALRDHIRGMWDLLARPASATGEHASLLALPHPYVVPGGRFQEIYYWDSFFTMLGLQADGRDDLCEAMIDNFVSIIERYDHVPNGSRTYYLSRSQPPFFALMIGLSRNADATVNRRRLKALKREHAWWMRGASQAGASGAAEHVVALPAGGCLNRYWDPCDRPRPESHFEDVETASRSGRPAAEVYQDIRAAAESGWDFSSRWLADGRSLSTIRTTAIAPVDLNCLLHQTELQLSRMCHEAGEQTDSATYLAAAEARAENIRRHLWDERQGCFADWIWREGAHVKSITAASLFPLFAGVATPEQASRTADEVAANLLVAGGLRTSILHSGEQWDAPNGWAPLQWIAIAGLRRYDHHALADEIARRWLSLVEDVYLATGVLFEKYDVEMRRAGGGGEYVNQVGFGWTNGVTQALIAQGAPA